MTALELAILHKLAPLNQHWGGIQSDRLAAELRVPNGRVHAALDSLRIDGYVKYDFAPNRGSRMVRIWSATDAGRAITDDVETEAP